MRTDDICGEKKNLVTEKRESVLERSRYELRLGIVRPLDEAIGDVAEMEDLWNTRNI